MMQSSQMSQYQRSDFQATELDHSTPPYHGHPTDSQTYPMPSVSDASREASTMLTSPLTLNLWPTSSQPDDRSRPPSSVPATSYEGASYPFPEDQQQQHQQQQQQQQGMGSWDADHLKVAQAQQMGRPLSAPSDCFTFPPASTAAWGQAKQDESLDLENFVAGIHGNSPSFAINNENILDLRIPVSGMEEHGAAMQTHHARHFSGSSSSVSSNGPVGENLAYEDFNSTYNTPEASDFHSRDLNQPSTTLNSAVASPHQSFQATPPRGVTRSRAGSQPTRPTSSSNQQTPSSARFAPYSMDQRRKHWTTDAVSPTPNRNWSPLVYKRPQRFAPQGAWSSSYQSSPQQLPSSELPYQYGNMPNQQLYRSPQSHISPYPQGIMPHDACGDPQPHIHPQLQNPPPLMSHGLFRMLQSNADPINHQRYRYADLSDPPDLFASLHDKQLAPPEEDMNPSDPDLIPHEQELRFDGDLYTPRWVRGHGNKREGWCGICKPGRWLVLKNSAFWYDKSFSHGVSAATGSQFQEPQDTRRMDGNPDVWEGLCGSCNEWVALVSSKKKGTTWFRHAYKCHTHLKVKDAPKRKRESSHTRSLAANTGSSTNTASPSPPRSVPPPALSYPRVPPTSSMPGAY